MHRNPHFIQYCAVDNLILIAKVIVGFLLDHLDYTPFQLNHKIACYFTLRFIYKSISSVKSILISKKNSKIKKIKATYFMLFNTFT